MGVFCEWEKTDGGVFHLKLTGGADSDGNHYLTKEGLAELRHELSAIRKLAGSPSEQPCRGLITSSVGGSFCEGIDYATLRRQGQSLAKHAKELSDAMAGVTKELMSMPMPTVCAATGHARSLGLALALAHDDLVLLSGGSYKLGMVGEGVAVEPHVAALVLEKTDRFYTIYTLKSVPRSGNWMRRWYFADAEGGSPDGVLLEAERLVAEWWDGASVSAGEVRAGMRRQLYCESWNAACAVVPDRME